MGEEKEQEKYECEECEGEGPFFGSEKARKIHAAQKHKEDDKEETQDEPDDEPEDDSGDTGESNGSKGVSSKIVMGVVGITAAIVVGLALMKRGKSSTETEEPVEDDDADDDEVQEEHLSPAHKKLGAK